MSDPRQSFIFPTGQMPQQITDAINARMRAESARVDINPYNQNIQVGRTIEMQVNPLVNAIANNRVIANNQMQTNPLVNEYDDSIFLASIRRANRIVYVRDPYDEMLGDVSTIGYARVMNLKPISREGSRRLLERRRLYENPQPPSSPSTNPRSRFFRNRNQENPPQ